MGLALQVGDLEATFNNITIPHITEQILILRPTLDTARPGACAGRQGGKRYRIQEGQRLTRTVNPA